MLAACTTATDADVGGADDADDAESSEEALTSTGASTYYLLRRDTRRCVAPLCGGFWIHRVNRTDTRCADGTYAAECYVAELDLFPAKLPITVLKGIRTAADRYVLRGTMRKKTFTSWGALGSFRATEAWRAPAAGAPTGTFYRVDESDAVCEAAPCATLRERRLNASGGARLVAAVDLAGAPGSANDQAETLASLSAHGLVVAGTNVTAASATTLEASQYYTRVLGELPEGATCGAGDVCATGTKCCYPCGIQGCQNRCVATTTSGECPLFP
jgi:hypothetical protein